MANLLPSLPRWPTSQMSGYGYKRCHPSPEIQSIANVQMHSVMNDQEVGLADTAGGLHTYQLPVQIRH